MKHFPISGMKDLSVKWLQRFGLLVVILVLLLSAMDTQLALAAATNTPTETDTPVPPTATRTLTHTPVPPTATPTLTATDTSTPTSTFTPTPTPISATITCDASCGAFNPTNAVQVSWTVQFGATISGLTGTNFTLSHAGLGGSPDITVTSVGLQPSKMWTVTATTGSSGEGDLVLALKAGSVGSVGATGEAYHIDHIVPAVESIKLANATPASPTKSDTLTFTVKFSEVVKPVATANFSVVGSTAHVASVDPTTDSQTYTVTVSGSDLADYNGTVGLQVVNDPVIQDKATNSLVSTTPTGINESYVVDNDAPTVESITFSNPSKSPTNATALVFLVTFDEDVKHVDPGDFTIVATPSAPSSSLSTARSVVRVTDKEYKVTLSDQNTGDNLASYNGTVALQVATTTITDLAENPLSGPMPTGNQNRVYTVDHQKPTVSITYLTPPSTPHTSGVTDSPPLDYDRNNNAEFNFTSTEQSEFKCKLDSNQETDCSSHNSGTYPWTGYVNYGGALLNNREHTFRVYAIDEADNQSNVIVYKWTVDTSIPYNVSIDASPDDPSGTAETTFKYSIISKYVYPKFRCALDSDANGDITFSDCTKNGAGSLYSSNPDRYKKSSSKDYNGNDFEVVDGRHIFRIYAVGFTGYYDNQGDKIFARISPTIRYVWTINTSAATVLITPPYTNNITNSPDPSFSFHISPSSYTADSYMCRWDKVGSFQSCVSPASHPGLPEVPHTFEVYAKYNSNKETPIASYTWTIDWTPPTAFIDIDRTNLRNPSNDPAPVFYFSAVDASDIQTYECALIPPDSAPTPTPTTPAPLPGFAPCDPETGFHLPSAYTLVDGATYTFKVYAIDEANNDGSVDLTTYGDEFTWTADFTPPDGTEITVKNIHVSPDANPAIPALTNSASADFSFTNPSADFDSFWCSRDGVEAQCSGKGSWNSSTQLWEGSQSYSNLTGVPVPHTFQVQAKDKAGNTHSITYTWTVDTDKPGVTIEQSPPPLSNTAVSYFGFSSPATDFYRFVCKLDNTDDNSYAPCSGSNTWDLLKQAWVGSQSYSLGDGPHTFQVRAIDNAGNFTETPSDPGYEWKIDTVPPRASITDWPPNPSNKSQPTFYFSSTEPSKFGCQIVVANGQVNPANYSACGSTNSYQATGSYTPTAPLAGGDAISFQGILHTFYVYACDEAGNCTGDPNPVVTTIPSYPWVVDTVAPNIEIKSQPPSPPTPASHSNFIFSSSDPTAIFMCLLESAENTIPSPYNVPYPCLANQTFIDLADGIYHLKVYSQDPAENQSAPLEATWDLKQPPSLTYPSNPSFDIAQIFQFASVSPVRFECSLDGDPFDVCLGGNSATYYTEGVSVGASNYLSYGPHSFSVRAIDSKGHVSVPDVYPYLWVANSTVITSKPSATTISRVATFYFKASHPDQGITFECALDGDANNPNFEPCASPKVYSNLELGNHTFKVRATQMGKKLNDLGKVIDAKIIDDTPDEWPWTILQQERLLNGGFNKYSGTLKIPTGWTAFGFTKVDGKDTSNKKEGIASVKMVGTGKLKTLTQTWNLPVAGSSGAKFDFSFYVKGLKLSATGTCKAEVTLYRVVDALPWKATVPCPASKTGTYNFTIKKASFLAPWSFSKVVVQFIFNKPSGQQVWFDQVSLLE